MILRVDKKSLVLFDLDDTLYSEYDFLCSAYHEIASKCAPRNTQAVYDFLINSYHNKRKGFEDLLVSDLIEQKEFDSVEYFLNIYRNHRPVYLSVKKGVQSFLESLALNNITLGVISDGRSITQRNKLAALGILSFFKKIIISEEFGSEKPNINNFKSVQVPEYEKYVYIADNIQKDFISPNKLGWITIGLLDDGKNIHKQNLQLPKEYLPQIMISSIEEICLRII